MRRASQPLHGGEIADSMEWIEGRRLMQEQGDARKKPSLARNHILPPLKKGLNHSKLVGAPVVSTCTPVPFLRSAGAPRPVRNISLLFSVRQRACCDRR